MLLLHIETSTTICSVALSQNSECIFFRMNTEGMNHAALLSVFVDEALEILRPKGLKPDAVCVSAGPGSYTGLRIGVSTAKGLCYGFQIPLIAIDTLKVMTVEAFKVVSDKSALFCPMIDARRMEVYAAIYNDQLQTIREVSADIIDEESYVDFLNNNVMYFYGNGADKCKETISHPNARFIDNIHPLAQNMIVSGEQAYNEANFVNLAYYEPFYLKEFQATTPKKTLG